MTACLTLVAHEGAEWYTAAIWGGHTNPQRGQSDHQICIFRASIRKAGLTQLEGLLDAAQRAVGAV
jgi:hypothetical protein